MLTPRRQFLATALVSAAALAVSACGTPQAANSIAPTDLYADFVACEPLPTAIEYEPVEGLVQVDGMVVTDVRRTGQVVSITGLIDLTPLQLRDIFNDRADVEVIHVEDEGYETEVLVGSEEHRTFLKATIRCRTGSSIALVVAPAADAALLPAPGQAK